MQAFYTSERLASFSKVSEHLVIRVGGLTLQVTLPPKVPTGESSDISRTLPA